MKTIEQINQEIDSLEKKLQEVKGTQTEVYTRIVGYHRAIDNWNKGKKEEYKFRVPFKFNQNDIDEKNLFQSRENIKPNHQSTPLQANEKVFQNDINPDKISFYKLFSSQICRNCPPVKEFMKNINLNGEEIDVSTDIGISVSKKYDIMSTPTVIFFDNNNNIVYEAHSVSELKNIFSKAKELV